MVAPRSQPEISLLEAPVRAHWLLHFPHFLKRERITEMSFIAVLFPHPKFNNWPILPHNSQVASGRVRFCVTFVLLNQSVQSVSTDWGGQKIQQLCKTVTNDSHTTAFLWTNYTKYVFFFRCSSSSVSFWDSFMVCIKVICTLSSYCKKTSIYCLSVSLLLQLCANCHFSKTSFLPQISNAIKSLTNALDSPAANSVEGL